MGKGKTETNQNAKSMDSALSEYQEDKANRKRKTDALVKGGFGFSAFICASVIVFIVGFVLYKGLMPFIAEYRSASDQSLFGRQNFWDFITGNTWNGGEFNHAAGYLALQTLYITLLSLLISVPVSVFTALFIGRSAPKPLSHVFQTGIELLAGIPSVIFGLFGMGVINPAVMWLGNILGYQTSGGNSLLSGVVILAMMSVPTMTMMSVTAVRSVDPALTKASMALGASKTQTDFKIVLKDAQSGIFAGIILGLGRAIGEATAIQMVIGNALSGPRWDLFSTSATVTTQMLMGIGEATPGTMGYDIRFSAGILLMVMIIVMDLGLNYIKDSLYARRTGKPRRRGFVYTTFRPLWLKTAKSHLNAGNGNDD